MRLKCFWQSLRVGLGICLQGVKPSRQILPFAVLVSFGPSCRVYFSDGLTFEMHHWVVVSSLNPFEHNSLDGNLPETGSRQRGRVEPYIVFNEAIICSSIRSMLTSLGPLAIASASSMYFFVCGPRSNKSDLHDVFHHPWVWCDLRIKVQICRNFLRANTNTNHGAHQLQQTKNMFSLERDISRKSNKDKLVCMCKSLKEKWWPNGHSWASTSDYCKEGWPILANTGQRLWCFSRLRLLWYKHAAHHHTTTHSSLFLDISGRKCPNPNLFMG